MKQRGILRPALMLLMSLAVMLSIAGAALAGGSGPFHFGFKKRQWPAALHQRGGF